MMNYAAQSNYSLPPSLRRNVYAHAKAQFPKEACGIIVEDCNGLHRFVACENTHEDPESHFRISPYEIESATQFSRLVAIVHSHTQGQGSPSADDMRGQIATGVPWIIVVLRDGEISEDFHFPVDLAEPLKGMSYRHGVRDCYTAIRKWWFHNKGVVIPEFPRDDEWWATRDGQPQPDLYMEGFEKAGFRRLTPEEVLTDPNNPRSPMLLMPGDVGLGRINSKIINHGVVYTGGQLMYHHLFNRVGAEEPVTRWLSRIEVWLRRNEDHNEPHSPLRPDGRDLPEATEV